jgi:anti-anti-sigma factor
MHHKPDRPLCLEIRREGQGVVVSLHGCAGMEGAEDVRAALDSLAGDRATPIVLDLSDMDFICSAGLGAIIAARAKSRTYEGRVALVNPKPEIRQVLETMRLTQLFPVFATVGEAMAC